MRPRVHFNAARTTRRLCTMSAHHASTADPAPSIPLGQLALIAEAIGPVADAIGTPHFLRELYQCVVRFADCDALHLQCTHGTGEQRRVEWIGSHGLDIERLERTMQLYFGQFAHCDPTYARSSGSDDVEVIQVSAQGIEDSELRRLVYDAGDIHDECMVLRPAHGATYSLSICRSRRLPPFSLKELSLVKHLGQIVLPIAAAHARLAGVAHDTGHGGDGEGGVASDARRAVDPLAACITQRRVELSAREAAVCSAFVQGMTAEAAARALGVKPSTVETYAKRAFAKLGVGSRRELLSLVHGEARTALATQLTADTRRVPR